MRWIPGITMEDRSYRYELLSDYDPSDRIRLRYTNKDTGNTSSYYVSIASLQAAHEKNEFQNLKIPVHLDEGLFEI